MGQMAVRLRFLYRILENVVFVVISIIKAVVIIVTVVFNTVTHIWQYLGSMTLCGLPHSLGP